MKPNGIGQALIPQDLYDKFQERFLALTKLPPGSASFWGVAKIEVGYGKFKSTWEVIEGPYLNPPNNKGEPQRFEKVEQMEEHLKKVLTVQSSVKDGEKFCQACFKNQRFIGGYCVVCGS